MTGVGNIRNVTIMLVGRFDSTSKFRQLANILRARITLGEPRPRDPIPSESSMIADHGITRDTVRAAVALLREEGYVITLPQWGTSVAPKESWPAE
jgi:GntR family transcriptional regulator